MPDTPQPVTGVEKKIDDAAPSNLRPEVEQVEAEFNTAVEDAAAKSPEAEAQAAKVDPGVETAAQDAAAIAGGKTVNSTKLASDAGVVFKEVKAGWKTTEFWMAAAVIVLTQVGAFHIPGKYGDTIATASAATAYILSRGLAK